MNKLYIFRPCAKDSANYMRWFADAWIKRGIRCVQKEKSIFNLFFLLQVCRRKGDYLIIPMGGGTCLDDVFPFCYKYNIIPYIWDCWPNTWKNVLQMMKILYIEKCFIYPYLICNELSREMLNTQFLFVPEGTNSGVYRKVKERLMFYNWAVKTRFTLLF